jgi:hypothetical protein
MSRADTIASDPIFKQLNTVIASEAKQSTGSKEESWIASLRSQ